MATVANGLKKRYGRHSPWVLDGVDLRLGPGTVTVVIGDNGSGKSTLLRVLAGVSRPTAGRISSRPATIGYVPERLPSRIRMTGRTYLAHMARLHGLSPGAAVERADELARRFAVQPGLGTPIAALSKGNNQKIALAQALLAPVELLLLDEPWNGLAPAAGEALAEELAAARRHGTATLVTAHRHGTVPEPDQIFMLRDGRLAEVPSGTALAGTALAAVVELLPPRRGSGPPPAWTGVQHVALVAGRWRLDVTAAQVDDVLARALTDGWSVHRVDPPAPPGATGAAPWAP